jgi:hypothetical protein
MEERRGISPMGKKELVHGCKKACCLWTHYLPSGLLPRIGSTIQAQKRSKWSNKSRRKEEVKMAPVLHPVPFPVQPCPLFLTLLSRSLLCVHIWVCFLSLLSCFSLLFVCLRTFLLVEQKDVKGAGGRGCKGKRKTRE